MIELTCEVVRLRPLDDGDAELVVAWRSRSDVAAQLFGVPPTLEEHRRWSAQALSRGDREEYVICWRREADRPVGTIGLSAISSLHRRAEYGILVGDPEVRRRGVARAASKLILYRAFSGLGLERVYLYTFADNAPAIALYEGLGFSREGLLRAHARRQDATPRDVVVMGLLQREWAARDG